MWSNKVGTSERECKCGSWKQHWINYSHKDWPKSCSVESCTSAPTLGAHVIHSKLVGERIVPMCDACNKLEDKFAIKSGVSFPSANKSQTCEKPETSLRI